MRPDPARTDEAENRGGGNFRVYTPFWKALDGSGEPPEPIPAPKAIGAPAAWPKSEALDDWGLLPTRPNWAKGFETEWQPGEVGAHKRLADFVKSGLKGYRTRRDFPGEAHVSMLSPHLALGEISPASVWHATRGCRRRMTARMSSISARNSSGATSPITFFSIFRISRPGIGTPNSDAFPGATRRICWKNGKRPDGYPIVDAGMRQLWQTGFMHNRVRMIVASS